jgi:hypothetical protein
MPTFTLGDLGGHSNANLLQLDTTDCWIIRLIANATEHSTKLNSRHMLSNKLSTSYDKARQRNIQGRVARQRLEENPEPLLELCRDVLNDSWGHYWVSKLYAALYPLARFQPCLIRKDSSTFVLETQTTVQIEDDAALEARIQTMRAEVQWLQKEAEDKRLEKELVMLRKRLREDGDWLEEHDPFRYF